MSVQKPVRIVVLQRGWVLVGRFSQEGERCQLHDASVIRVWGTTEGLGELIAGPTSSTKLDPCGTATFHELTVVFTLDAEERGWASALR